MRETIKAYVAGIVDGEGSITLTRRSANKYPCPEVAVDSTDRELLEFLIEHFGGRIVVKKKYKEHHKQAWTWKVSYNAALSLLEVVLPFLVLDRKRARAKLLLTEYRACTPRNGKYTPAMIKAKEELYEKFRAC